MNLLIAGDFYISEDCRGKDVFDHSVKTVFRQADYRIVNLETPITLQNDRNKILKTGPHLCSTKETILPLLKTLHIDLAALANNHIMDYGMAGLNDTLMNLKSAGIDSVGAGMNLAKATQPFIFEKDGVRAAVLNFAENEWSTAAPDKPGAAPLDMIENLRQIREAKQTCEFVVVLIHGGFEDFHFPSPRMVNQYRFYAENGASVIIGHHPHCISGYEVHRGSPIFYSLGNFIFTQPSELDSWYTGLAVDVHLERHREVSWELVPTLQSKSGYHLILPEGEKKEAIRREVEGYSRIIADQTRLGQIWEKFLSDWKRYYLGIFSPLNIIQSDSIRFVLEKLRLGGFFIKKKHYAQILNHIRCEAHAEAAKGVIKHFLE